jgi:hypothetical protein
MLVQLHPVTLNTHASPGFEHAPSHWGASALPHETVRHSHDPPETVAPQRAPAAAHVPRHWPFVNVQLSVPDPGNVVLVVTGVPGAMLAGQHIVCGARSVTLRAPKTSCAWARNASGRGHLTV